MKRLMLGLVIATLSASSFADDNIDVKKVAKAVCKDSKVEARTVCEDLVISTATSAFAVGQLAGICEYAIGINAEPELVQLIFPTKNGHRPKRGSGFQIVPG